jgi:CRISPR-associated protein Cmr3
MSDTILELRPLAPLLLRDGRPFAGGGEESRAQSLPAPLPHTLAGFIRTQLGQRQGWNWQDDRALHEHLRRLHGVPVRSLLTRDDAFMFPAPLNAVVDRAGKIHRAAPYEPRAGEGTDAPENLTPLLLDPEPGENLKPEVGYAYWPTEAMQAWLLNQPLPQLEKVSGPPADERTHVSIDPVTGTGVDGELFSVTYRSFEERDQAGQFHRWALRVKTDVAGDIAPLGHLGGERRPVAVQDVGNQKKWPNISEFGAVKEALLDPGSTRLCFILTSPALFAGGWKPGWLALGAEEAQAHNGDTLPAGVRAIAGRVRLVGAAVGRRVPVSGWSLRANKPKAVRWAVPAGSVYFLEVQEGQVLSATDRQKLVDAWLKPLSDEQNHQRDGFGCALWGVW